MQSKTEQLKQQWHDAEAATKQYHHTSEHARYFDTKATEAMREYMAAKYGPSWQTDLVLCRVEGE